jgi:hypothetical protein
MARAGSLAALILGLSLAVGIPASATELMTAPTGLRLSPKAMKEAERMPEGMAAPSLGYHKPEIRPTGGGRGDGIARFDNGAFVGAFRQETNPFNAQARYWVLDEGIYARTDGVRYAGAFHYFHEDWGDYAYNQEDWEQPHGGRYFLAGSRIGRDGKAIPGIYTADVSSSGISDFTPADESYLAWFEGKYETQVAAFKRAQAEEESGGLSFGQVLALGLGGLALSQADIPVADAVEIGGAFAGDVLSDGRTNALAGVVRQKRAAATAGGVAGSSAAPDSAAGGYSSEQVAVDCPSGVSSTIPISYRTRQCRSAMIEFARVYACNLIDDMGTVAQRCRSACGNVQCRE